MTGGITIGDISIEHLKASANKEIRNLLDETTDVKGFLARIPKMSVDDMQLIVEQAIRILDGYYVHLPMKKAMYATDPVQRLRLLRRQLQRGHAPPDLVFHRRMSEIFASMRDLHTVYVWPESFSQYVALLPFRIEHYFEGTAPKYLVSKVMRGADANGFEAGVEVTHWNGVPIARAVEILGEQHSGSNAAARHARGLDSLTIRTLHSMAPPDEEWVAIGYIAADGSARAIRAHWLVLEADPRIALDGIIAAAAQEEAHAPPTGLDLQGHSFTRLHGLLFGPGSGPRADAPEAQAVPAGPAAAAPAPGTAEVRKVADIETTFPSELSARVVEIAGKRYGHIRIFTFAIPNDAHTTYVDEMVRLLERPEMPKDGLILDVRGNGGGKLYFAEGIPQLFVPHPIEPMRYQFISTPSTTRLCAIWDNNRDWLKSLDRAEESGALYSAALTLQASNHANRVGQRYYGPVALITDARCYSATDTLAASFQDNGVGPILGVDPATGAGGAIVIKQSLLQWFHDQEPLLDPIKKLPQGVNFRFAVQRTIRVGAETGTEIEDFGVVPDERHFLTRNDVLSGNVDLLAHAARLLAGKPARRFDVNAQRDGLDVRVDMDVSDDVHYVTAYVDDRIVDTAIANNGRIHFDLRASPNVKLELKGYRELDLVCAKRLGI